MTQITEIDTNKHIVMKTDDVLRFSNEEELRHLTDLREKIDLRRKEEGKRVNHYLVLNLDDEIDSVVLYTNIQKARWKVAGSPINMKVSDIAVALVNAILKAKEKP